MRIIKMLSVLTSAVLLSGAVCPQAILPDGAALFSAPLTASAAGAVMSGQTGVKSVSVTGATLYFSLNAAQTGLALCGCRLTGSGVSITIPKTVRYNGKNYNVTEISDYAFYNQAGLSYISGDHETVTAIGNAAFYNCVNLTGVGFSDRSGSNAVRTIGESAFSGCTSLSNMQFASKAETIGAHAFFDCTNLYRIDLDAALSIGNAAFYHCSGAEAIDLSGSHLTTVPLHAFANCEQAREIHLPEGLSELGTMAFAGCRAVDTIYLPDSVTAIGESAFLCCDALKTVMMPEGVISVGDTAFFECPSMTYFVCKNPNAFLGSYSVGWHLENGFAVRNPGFVIWSTGSGRVWNHAVNNGFEKRDVRDAAAQAKDRYADYVWKSNNDNATWHYGSGLYFNAQHTPYARGLLGQRAGGVCSGLATVSALTASGYLSVSDFAPGYSRISELPTGSALSQDTVSYISTVYANFIQDYDYITEKPDSSQPCVFGKEMLRYAEYINYGADPAVFVVRQFGDGADHAMVCIGLEFREYADDASSSYWNNRDFRMLIYDVNRPALTDRNLNTDSVYFSFGNNTWYWPRSGNTGQFITNNCEFYMVHTPDKMVWNPLLHTAPEFFDAIRLPSD